MEFKKEPEKKPFDKKELEKIVPHLKPQTPMDKCTVVLGDKKKAERFLSEIMDLNKAYVLGKIDKEEWSDGVRNAAGKAFDKLEQKNLKGYFELLTQAAELAPFEITLGKIAGLERIGGEKNPFGKKDGKFRELSREEIVRLIGESISSEP